MGTTPIDPRASSPRRLVRHDGRWTLEIERLVPVGRTILRPEIESVSGEDSILSHLETPRTRALGLAASQIMRTSGVNTEDRAFEPAGSGWIAAKGEGVALASGGTPLRDAETEALVASMRRKMTRELAQLAEAEGKMARQIDLLVQRVAALEGAAPKEPAGLPEKPGVLLPETADLSVLVQTLMKGKVTARETAPADRPVLDGDLSPFYASTLLDDGGAVVGLILGDARTTILVGAALMSLDEAQIQEHLAAGTPPEDIVACASEVFAALASGVNQVPGNARVRASYLERCAEDAHPWAASARRRLDLEDSNGGRVVILAR